MQRERKLSLYAWGLGLAGLAALVGTQLQFSEPFRLDILVFMFFGCVAQLISISLGKNTGSISFSFSVMLGAYLLFGDVTMLWVQLVSSLVGNGYRVWKNRRPLYVLAYNVGQFQLMMTMAAAVFRILAGPDWRPGTAVSSDFVLPTLGFTAVAIAVNMVLISIYFMLRHGNEYRLQMTWNILRWDAVTYAFTIPFGLIISRSYRDLGDLGLVLVFIPLIGTSWLLKLYWRVIQMTKEKDAIYRVAMAANHSLDLDEMLQEVLDSTGELLNYYIAVIYISDPRTKEFVPIAHRVTQGDNYPLPSIPWGKGIVGDVARTKAAEIVPDIYKDPRRLPHPGAEVMRCLMVVPLIYDGRVIGLFNLGSTQVGGFTQEHVGLINVLSGSIAMALRNAQMYRETYAKSITDGKTGLYNYAYLLQQMEHHLGIARDTGSELSVVILDIDHFKQFNDRYGHVAGDQALIHIANVMKEAVRENDIVARYGGEEFIIVLPQTPTMTAWKVAERVRASVNFTPVQLDGQKITLTVSAGVATFPYHGEEAVELIHQADKAMYMGAKQRGRNLVSLVEN